MKSTQITKLPRETLFQTGIKETRCLVSEYHIFRILYNIMLFLHEKDTLSSKFTRETLFQTVIKEKPDVLFLNIIFLTIFIIFIIST